MGRIYRIHPGIGIAHLDEARAGPDRIYRIHPGIGVARVGNCQSAAEGCYFLGPEVPGDHNIPPGGYKLNGEIKRQGARFRIYEYARVPVTGTWRPVREITREDAEITWMVTLANRKAYAPRFPPQSAGTDGLRLRNAAVREEADRQRLLIIAASESIRDSDPGPRPLDGYFMDPSCSREAHRVHLGDLLTDDQGRLIVLGGYGRAFSPINAPLSGGIFNNDGWCDDTSDGTIRARLTWRETGGTWDSVDAARLIVGPPDFAPAIENVVSLYDIAEDAAARLLTRPLPDPETVSFSRHIFPILKRAVEMRWVTRSAAEGHARGGRGDFLDPELLAVLRDPDNRPGSAAGERRQQVFSRLRVPPGAGRSGPRQDMPRLSGESDTSTPSTLTPRQYRLMQRWADGEFDPEYGMDLDAPPPSFEQIPDVRQQIEALDRAGLDACVGSSFYPGIEASRIMREPAIYSQPFRLLDDLPAGSLTEGMALPWQTDFQACGQGWWPAQRPTDVLRRDPDTVAYRRVSWANLGELGGSFVTGWPNLEYVVPEGDLFVRE